MTDVQTDTQIIPLLMIDLQIVCESIFGFWLLVGDQLQWLKVPVPLQLLFVRTELVNCANYELSTDDTFASSWRCGSRMIRR